MSRHRHSTSGAAVPSGHAAGQVHAHGAGISLEPSAHGILTRGLGALLDLTSGLEPRPTPSRRNPLPLALAVYGAIPSGESVRADVRSRLEDDPVSVLEYALVLLEIYETNQDDIGRCIQEDGPFLDTCFTSKRRCGWAACVGDSDRAAVEAAVMARWQFDFYNGPARPTGIYVLLNMLARYGAIYGRIRAGDAHALSHFVEDFAPGVLVLCGAAGDLELTLSLAAMKMGVPGIVPSYYPFPLGRTFRADGPTEIAAGVASFSNVRRLLPTPEIPQLPDYCREEHLSERFEPAVVWGDTPESFYILRKGSVETPGAVSVTGSASGPMGVILTVDAEPLDEFDRRYLERSIHNALSMVSGVLASYNGDRLVLRLREPGALSPAQLGETLLASLRHEFPKIERASVEVVFDRETLASVAQIVADEKASRAAAVAAATEESVDFFYSCAGCSPFAPDHLCILTPERPPQCGRPYEMIKAGAHYAWDDMSNIHHSSLHRDANSFAAFAKGRCLDPIRGRWSGVDAEISRRTRGRTPAVDLHAVDARPHTGCGCFRLVMFATDMPRGGIAVMDAGYEGHAPDGRSWRDLHYSLAGKQTAGIAGAPPAYLLSKKFLTAHGGWSAVVWVSPKIAQFMGARLPEGIEVGF